MENLSPSLGQVNSPGTHHDKAACNPYAGVHVLNIKHRADFRITISNLLAEVESVMADILNERFGLAANGYFEVIYPSPVEPDITSLRTFHKHWQVGYFPSNPLNSNIPKRLQTTTGAFNTDLLGSLYLQKHNLSFSAELPQAILLDVYLCMEKELTHILDEIFDDLALEYYYYVTANEARNFIELLTQLAQNAITEINSIR